MSSISDNSEDTDEFILGIRKELEQRDISEDYTFTTLIQGARHNEVPIDEEQPLGSMRRTFSTPKKGIQYTNDDDIDKLLYGHSSSNNRSLESYLTDDEYELESRDQKDVDFNQTPMTHSSQHGIVGKDQLLSYQQLGTSPPDVFMTPMHFIQTPASNWNEKEIQNLKNKINRQTLTHKSELDEHLSRERNAQFKLEKSHDENQCLMKSMKTQLSTLQQKIREMQSEKVQLASEYKQQNLPKDDVNKFKEIAGHYKCIAKEQGTKVLNLQELIHGLNADINQLNIRISDKDKELNDMKENLKDQAREFAVQKMRKESEAQENLNKSQKLHHREKVLSVAKLQEDLSQTHNEEIHQLKNTLLDDKNRALSRLDDSLNQKLTKAEEHSKKLEKELKYSAKKVEEKDDAIKVMESQHKKEVQQLNSEIYRLQSNIHKSSKDLTQNKAQVVAKVRQDTEEQTLYRIQLAVESNQKSLQTEINKLKTNLKRTTDKLAILRDQNQEFVKRDKEKRS
ncbi:hypothetical protein LOD99_7233 [Oopsacas minuta]|uniref:Uncharacterized protein n=1 Tax=Oopsacas minuta TaxID=111878 RepID=A0AAV7JU59_9METZ|nr:hypothetical protein LOD99_7233 [Oopsacas minuta]